MSTERTIRSLGHFATAGLFLAIVWAPFLDSFFGLAPTAGLSEKRDPVPLPAMPRTADDMRAFPKAFESWYDDHFGFREVLIRCNNIAKAKWIGVSPSEEVVIGREGWLYYAGQGNIDLYRAADPMDAETLQIWQRHLEELHDWFDDRGIPFHFVVAPSKTSIYPEYLPRTIRRVGTESRLDQLVRHLEENSYVRFLDLRPTLLAAKERELVYRRTDTHWNVVGAFAAYREIQAAVRAFFPSIPEARIEDWQRSSKRQRGGDVSTLLGMSDIFDEETPEFEPLHPIDFEIVTEDLIPTLLPARAKDGGATLAHERKQAFAYLQDAPELPHLVFFRDSFASSLLGFLPRDYRRSVYYWQYRVDPRVVYHESPDIVLQEVAERYFVRRPIPNLREIRRDFEIRREFRASRKIGPHPDAEPVSMRPQGDSYRSVTELPSTDPGQRLLLRYETEVNHTAQLELIWGGSDVAEPWFTRTLHPGRNIGYVVLEGGRAELLWQLTRDVDPILRKPSRVLETRLAFEVRLAP